VKDALRPKTNESVTYRQKLFGTKGTLALIPLIDLFNHHQPEIYKRDYIPFYLIPKANFMGVAVEKKFNKGEEVIYTYS
jgi:hypothetical protein